MADTIFGRIQEEKDLYKLSNGENPSYIWFNEKVNIFALYKQEYYNDKEDFQFKVGVGIKL